MGLPSAAEGEDAGGVVGDAGGAAAVGVGGVGGCYWRWRKCGGGRGRVGRLLVEWVRPPECMEEWPGQLEAGEGAMQVRESKWGRRPVCGGPRPGFGKMAGARGSR